MKSYYLRLSLAITFTSSLVAHADNAVLENEFIRAGVNEVTGTLGSGGDTAPGLLYDVIGLGAFDNNFDYLTPGTPYEGWAVRIDDANGLQLQLYGNNNAGFSNNENQPVTGAWVGVPTASTAIWAGSAAEFGIRHTYSLPLGSNYLDIATRLEITSPIENLYFGRYIDPDAGAMAYGNDTDNARGYSVIPTTNAVFSEANITRYALGLYSAQIGNVNTSIQPGWSSDPKDYFDNVSSSYFSDPYECTFTCHGDWVIGIAFYSSNLSIGDILNYKYAYIFGPSSFAAAQDAVDGGGGGGDPGDSGFGVLVDVGDAIAFTPPTLVSTSESTITISDTSVVDSSLPVITASVAHHTASEAHGVQTIARETTTNVTTPMERTVVTKVRTTSVWSNGEETHSDSSPNSAVTLINSVVTTVDNDNFSGRIDQQSQLSELNKGINRRLNADAFRKDMVDGERYRMYMGGTYLSSNAGNGYDAKSNRVNIGVEADVNDKWIAGIQYNNVTTKLDGVDSYTKQNKNHAGLYSLITINDWIIKSDFGVADNNIKSNRNVEQTFFNASKTNGTDVWLSNRAYMPSINGMRPYAEFTFGNNERNAYVETGSVQSYRSISKVNDSINFGEFGVRYDRTIDKLSLTGEAGVSTDSYKDLKAELSYLVNPTSRLSWSYSRQEHKDLVSNSVALYGKINF